MKTNTAALAALQPEKQDQPHLPLWVVEYAVSVAMKSPCQSKRGVVILSPDGRRIISEGFNYQPAPFCCDGSDRCKNNCGRTAIHAEQSAILAAKEAVTGSLMLHLKAWNGQPCGSMAPSCLECSKLILASGIAWMHLLHEHVAQVLPGAVIVGEVKGNDCTDTLQVRRYSAAHFHWLTAEYAHRIELICPAEPAKEGSTWKR